jgi:hypothetical protein
MLPPEASPKLRTNNSLRIGFGGNLVWLSAAPASAMAPPMALKPTQGTRRRAVARGSKPTMSTL